MRERQRANHRHTSELWARVDEYFQDELVGADPGAGALSASADAGLPAVSVSPLQGKFLSLLVGIAGARSVLEIGTLGGYSTAWLATGLAAGGAVTTCEADPRHAEVAAASLRAAGVADSVRLLVGKALDSLPRLESEGAGPFDLVFVDADKARDADYLGWAVRLGRPGTVIVLDNVVRDGGVLDADSADPSVAGTRAGIELLAAHPRLDATALQTVGVKGYDGFVLAVVR